MAFFSLRPQPTRRVYGEISGERPARQKPRRVWLGFSWRMWLRIALTGIAGLFVAGTAVVAWVSKDLPDPNRLTDRHVAESTKIYDRTGQHLLYEVYQNEKRTIVNLDQMSWVPKATIAIEDKFFYQHSGIRLTSIIRAAFNNLIGRKAGGGGASTLTQQLIKNTIVGDEHSIFRKIKEAILAIRLEKKYTKDEILKLYMNEIPYGSTNYGVESAAQSYFHKSAKDLSLAESATLAAMVQAPSHYLNNHDELRNRRDTVLALMAEQGYITQAQKTEAQNTALRVYRSNGIYAAFHFVLYVKQLLADQFGEQLVDTGGLKVITSLDYDKQMMAEKTVKDIGDKLAKESNANNAALVAIDPHTAQILAMVGSRDFNNEDIDGQFNVVTLGRLQPGSSFKPFVYTAAFEKGYTPDTVLYDVNTDFDLRDGNNKYMPKNYDGKEHGLVTMRSALQGSLNIPAVKTMYLVGEQNVVDFAKRFGYSTFTGDYGLSLVLGGGEVSMLEHTNAYATLADNGVYHPPVSVLKVSDASNNTLYEWKENDGTEAVSSTLAAEITGVLSDDNARAYMFGLHSTLTLPDRPVAAKTGTTNNYYDAWTLGYVPSLAAGVWVGNTPKHNITMKGGGNKLAGLIWNQFMRLALASTTPEQFPTPPGNDAEKPVLRGAVGGIKLPIDKTTGRIASSTTPDNLIEYRTYLPPHDILYYVNKDDPRGPAPTNPENDPQYMNWENALQDWIRRQQLAGTPVVTAEPPTDADSGQSAELAPTVQIVSPTLNQIISTRQLHLEVTASAPRGVARVVWAIDGATITEVDHFPFVTDYTVGRLAPGAHLLKVIAADDQGNSAAQEVAFNYQGETDPADVTWVDASPLSLTGTDFPRVMNLNPWRWDATKDIKIYLKSPGKEKAIYDFNHADDKLTDQGQLTFTWNHNPGSGKHTLRAVLTDNQGHTVEKDLEITVK